MSNEIIGVIGRPLQIIAEIKDSGPQGPPGKDGRDGVDGEVTQAQLDAVVHDLDRHLADIVHTDEVNSTKKYPSAAVTYAHGQNLKSLNNKFPVYNNESQAGISNIETFDTLEEFVNALPTCMFVKNTWDIKSILPDVPTGLSSTYNVLVVIKPVSNYIKIEFVNCVSNRTYTKTRYGTTYTAWKVVDSTDV